MTLCISFTNPLSLTLAHYERELEETLNRCNISHEALSTRLVEGAHGPSGKLAMLQGAFLNVLSKRHGQVPNLQIWPSLGLLEARLWASNSVRNIVSIHDPVPLRRQVGFDQLSKRWARSKSRRLSPLLMVHSNDALRETQKLLPNHDVIKTLHPILSKQSLGPKSQEPTLIVAGQYKPERDLQMLGHLGPRLRAQGIQPEIHGRGWPSGIPGWEVHNRFVEEAELDNILSRAWAVLLPYSRYFQSGIAIRALEQGTLTVTPRTSFAEDLLGADSHSIIDDGNSIDQCFQAILRTINDQAKSVEVFAKYRDATDNSWRNGIEIATEVAVESRTRWLHPH